LNNIVIKSEIMAATFSRYHDVEAFLDSIPAFSTQGAGAARFGLERMEEICSAMDNPETRVSFVHVAGTNGKGTTCRLLASIFQEAGLKAGLYTSPHLTDIRERIQVDGEWISKEEMLRFFKVWGEDLERIGLSYFEITTALALWYFDQAGCDLVALETGLGGRLDATNVVNPVVSVITSISEDHTDLLGHSIEAIAREKGGIVKVQRPVVTGDLPDAALDVIREIALERSSRHVMSTDLRPEWRDGQVVLHESETNEWLICGSGRKEIDRLNIATCFRVIQILEPEWRGLLRAFTHGVEQMNQRYPIQGTFERLHSEEEWYFDGAHNDDAILSLMNQLKFAWPGREPVIVLSLMKDKATTRFLNRFRHFSELLYIDTGAERSAPCQTIRETLGQVRCYDREIFSKSNPFELFESELVIFTGSFYFYDQVKHWIASHSSPDQKIFSDQAL
jgi:dihydrofolate synthase / folylpolyglutamate synthase